MAQQLPLPTKFSENNHSSEETFEEWITHFELVAEIHKWNSQARLIHLIIRLRGEAFYFYRSCLKTQKSSHDLLVRNSHAISPVRIQSDQTSLFHDRKRKDNESVDTYAQDLKALFYKTYPQSQQGNKAAGSMGKSVLAYQFVAGLIPTLKPKLQVWREVWRSYLSKPALRKPSCVTWVSLRSQMSRLLRQAAQQDHPSRLHLPVTKKHCSHNHLSGGERLS
jgi:hypothetical protein